jgi:hypothetical protein
MYDIGVVPKVNFDQRAALDLSLGLVALVQ